ncbi:hypothetical protein FKG96_12270 [Olivibacter sp. LS-1]|uniref:hypothetical protein n=1 Tax=Olivibacter sp. LS-1 TaxID=2592345 RepID=UPI0011EB375E|nr:hypothetical protein [Olivibacter sp. LS-1]QEL01548.1 hypothetical protein FKG96_12270 [Olivibacter sp. LS-1]
MDTLFECRRWPGHPYFITPQNSRIVTRITINAAAAADELYLLLWCEFLCHYLRIDFTSSFKSAFLFIGTNISIVPIPLIMVPNPTRRAPMIATGSNNTDAAFSHSGSRFMLPSVLDLQEIR